MIDKVIDFSDKEQFLVFLFVGVAVLLGWNSMRIPSWMRFPTSPTLRSSSMPGGTAAPTSWKTR